MRAKARIALGNGDCRPQRIGGVCPSCRTDRRPVSAVDGGQVDRFNPNHVPSGEHGGEFASVSGGDDLEGHPDVKAMQKAHDKEVEQIHKNYDQQAKEVDQQYKQDQKDLEREHRKEEKEINREYDKEERKTNKRWDKRTKP